MTSETQRGTPYNGDPFTLTCFRQSPINPVHCNPVHPPPILRNRNPLLAAQ